MDDLFSHVCNALLLGSIYYHVSREPLVLGSILESKRGKWICASAFEEPHMSIAPVYADPDEDSNAWIYGISPYKCKAYWNPREEEIIMKKARVECLVDMAREYFIREPPEDEYCIGSLTLEPDALGLETKEI